MFWLSAIITGFVSSFHCIGMCGPIALTISSNLSNENYFLKNVIYNLGRVTTYCFIGLLMGYLGEGFRINGWQNILSISIGLLLIIAVLFKWLDRIKVIDFSFLFSFNIIKKSIQSKSIWPKYIIGLVNGLLPCSFVYFAAITAVVTQQISDAIIYMFLFGISTFPMMLFVAYFNKLFTVNIRKKLSLYSNYLLIIIASLLIYRGIFNHTHSATEHLDNKDSVAVCK